MEVPKLTRRHQHGCRRGKENAKILDSAVKDLETITGQKAVLTKG